MISNPIIYCESCNLGVHKRCIGLLDIDIDYRCDICLKTNQKKETKCKYCLQTGGAMKLVER
jgi:hypothetical protein